MKKLLLSLCLLASSMSAMSQTTRYVKPGGTGDGSSWSAASDDLQLMINNSAANDEVWVAGGTYKPLRAASRLDVPSFDFFGINRTRAFVLKADVKIYGGFAGTETLLTQRLLYLSNYTSTLTGDLDNSGALSDKDAYHVVIAAGPVGTAELNGFTITGGNNGINNTGIIEVNGRDIRESLGGGMLLTYASPILSNLIITGNNSSNGGGIYTNYSSPVLTHVTIKGNHAGIGGGMYNSNSSAILNTVNIIDNGCSWPDGASFGAQGGGIYNMFSSPVLTNVAILRNACSSSENSGAAQGGGMYNNYSSPNLINVTIAGNSTSDGGQEMINRNRSFPNVYNSIIYSHSGVPSDASSVPVYVNSLVQDNPAGTNMVTYSGDARNIFNNPPTDFSLKAGSPAINSGNNIYVKQIKDVLDNPRIRDSKVDLGAYEFNNGDYSYIPDEQGILYVRKQTNAYTPGNNWIYAIPELADALRFAKTNNELATNRKVTQIWVAGGLYKPLYRADNLAGPSTTDRNNAFLLLSNVKVYGGFAGTETTLEQRNLNNTFTQSVISGDFNGDDLTTGTGSSLVHTGNTENAYHVVIAAGAAANIELNGFTITGGNASDNSTITVSGQTLNENYGAGIYNSASSPVLANLKIINNSAQFYGGGIFNSAATPMLSNIVISANSASVGGGGMANMASSPAVLKNVDIRGNLSGYGGGILNSSSSPLLSNVLLTGNHATSVGGGGLYNSSASPILTNVTISGNTAKNTGSEMQQRTGTVTVNNTIILGSGTSPIAFASGGLIQASYSLVAGNPTGTGNINASDYSDTQIFNNPGNGNYSPLISSPVNNAGNNALYTGNINNDKDLSGNPRLYGAKIDMGAFEMQQNVPNHAISAIADLSKTYGDPDFSAGATANSGLPVTYTSSDISVVTVSAEGNLHIKSAGSSVITASQAGNADYPPAAPVSFKVDVAKKLLSITVTATNKVYDGSTAAQVNLSDNRLQGDAFNLKYIAAFADKNVGTAKIVQISDISIDGDAMSGNYMLENTTISTTADIKPATLIYTAAQVFWEYGTASPAPSGILTGFVGGESQASATSGTPSFTTTATLASPVGQYAVTGKGLTANNGNYVFEQAAGNGTALTIAISITLYVKKGITTGDFSGRSWANAMPELAIALKFAKINNALRTNAPVKQIWVAGGVYHPLYSPADNHFGSSDGRHNAFLMVKDVKIYGGFAGIETTLDQRNLSLTGNKSILSGDFNGDDLITGRGSSLSLTGNTENAYHVIISVHDAGDAQLNGFTITGGNGDKTGLDGNSAVIGITVNGEDLRSVFGGGIVNSYSSPQFNHLIVTGNYGVVGGGIFNSNASPAFNNVVISLNNADSGAGIVIIFDSSPKLTNVNISGNLADKDGGGMSNALAPSVTLTNVTISGNAAAKLGSEIYQDRGVTNIQNSVVYNSNASAVATEGGAAINATYSIVSDILAGVGNIDASKYTANQIFNDPINGNYALNALSPAINTATIGLYVPYSGNINTDKDLAGNPRLDGAMMDMGAYEVVGGKKMDIVVPTTGILYVKKGKTGNGSNWTNALGELSDALIFAKTNNEKSTNQQVKQIWVAGGIYKPMYSPEDGANFGTDKGRENTFLVVQDVKIYGGFAGTETDLAQRDISIVANKSTLSGDLNGDDGANLANHGENASHVIVGTGNVGSAEINGFEITGGYSGGSFSDIKTGSENVIHGYGGALYLYSCSPIVTNVTISGNYATYGGAFCNFMSSPILTNVTISGNNALTVGATFYNNASSPVLTNVTISGNKASRAGVFYNGNNSSPKVLNSIIYNNEGPNEVEGGSAVTYQNCLVEGNPNGSNMIAYGDDVSNLFINPQTPGLNTGGNYRLKTGSPAINKGSNIFYMAGQTPDLSAITTDLVGNPRFKGTVVDLGAYELQSQPQTINPIATVTKIYSDNSFEPGGTTTSGLVLSYSSTDPSIAETYQDAADGNKWKIKINKAGIVNITASQPGDANYDSATAVDFKLVIDKKPITIILNLALITKVYDANANAVITTGNLAFSPGSIVGTDDVSIAITGADATYDDKNAGTKKVVKMPLANLSLSGSAAGNYSIGNTVDIAASMGTITAKALTVKADNYRKVYDGAPYSGGNGVSYAGFAQGDNEINALTGILTYEGTAQQAIDAGTYTIVPKGYTAANYQISYTSGTLSIQPMGNNVISFKGLTDGANVSVTYGDGNTDASATSSTGLNVTYLSSSPSVATVDGNGTLTVRSVGTSTITASQPGDVNHQAATTVSFKLTVQKKALIIRANDINKVYDATAYTTGNGVSYTGFINGENIQNLTGTLAYSGTAINAKDVGSYLISPKGYGSDNYAITYQDGSLTINKADLRITADVQSKIFGDVDPRLTFKATGLLGSDVPTGSLDRAPGENAGIYAISQNTLSAGANYTISYTPANLTVGTKAITVTADVKSKVYGDVDPWLTFKVTGLVGSDVLTGSLDRVPGENAGIYAIEMNTLSAGANYTISYTPTNFNITKAVLTVTAANKQICEGGDFQLFTVVYMGFKWSDNANSLIKKPIVVTDANGSSPAGSYVLAPNGGSATNYTFNDVNGSLTIYSKPIPLITSNRSNQVSKGETLMLTASGGTTFTWSSADGIISGQQTNVLTVRPTITTTYMVTVGNANGCVETGSITIEVKDDFQAIKANNILTPNGDGINDVWTIANIDMYPNNTVTVFDKSGRILFTQKGYKNTWDGTFKGTPLAESTYYYIIDFGTDKLKQKGFITVIREQ